MGIYPHDLRYPRVISPSCINILGIELDRMKMQWGHDGDSMA
jgi:hypothetical protein